MAGDPEFRIDPLQSIKMAFTAHSTSLLSLAACAYFLPDTKCGATLLCSAGV
jgi:hypothetical protein